MNKKEAKQVKRQGKHRAAQQWQQALYQPAKAERRRNLAPIGKIAVASTSRLFAVSTIPTMPRRSLKWPMIGGHHPKGPKGKP